MGNLLSRSMHDLGAAAWFGGSLMGAVGLNGAAAQAKDPQERTRLSSVGWKKWTPVQVAAFGVHAIGGIGTILDNKSRLAAQEGEPANTVVKSVITVAGMAATLYSGVLGKKVAKLANEGGAGATKPRPGASKELASAQKQLQMLQWSLPLFSGAVIILGAREGELQRPQSLISRLTQ
ncbi:hypothetical protein GCM10027402_28360 [Arthrobacter monumenti]